MKDKTLKLIGRKHTSQDIINCFYMAREMGFGNINMDVIAGLPGEKYRIFENTMNYIETLILKVLPFIQWQLKEHQN